MGISNAGSIIREARLKAGLTQEKMSEGICAVKVLSRIETGMTNISHSTFLALMERAGVSYSAFPVFTNREDFDCFYALKRVRFHLNSWHLTPAYDELQKLAGRNWAGSKLYYQEWLLLHCRLQFRSYCCSHQQNYNTLLAALHITRPEINLSDFRCLLLSQNELQLLTSLAQEALYLGKTETCCQIHKQITQHLASSKLSLMEKEQMQAEASIVYVKYLIAIGKYDAALETAETYRHNMVLNMDTVPLLELTFLTGLCYHLTHEKKLAEKWIKASFYSAYATGCCYATACRDYLKTETDFCLTGDMACRPDIPLKKYIAKEFTDSLFLPVGFCDVAMNSSYTLGSLIRNLRMEQNVSQELLCQGLCSKSKLSKIENGSLQPDIMLSEALLQRLGISDRVFTFWGNQKETRFHDLKLKVIHTHHIPEKTISTWLNEMEQLLGKNDILYRQEYSFLRTLNQNIPGKRITGLMEALQLTLKNFNINQICSYRLTWCELSILNNLAMEYCLTSQIDLCFTYTSQIIAYT